MDINLYLLTRRKQMRNSSHKQKFGLLVTGALMLVLSGCGTDSSTPTAVTQATLEATATTASTGSTAPTATTESTAPTQGTTASGKMDHVRILVGGLSKQIYLPNTLAKQL